MSQAVAHMLLSPLHAAGSAPVLPQPPLLAHRFIPPAGAMETMAVTISEYSKVSHFYLKEITYYK